MWQARPKIKREKETGADVSDLNLTESEGAIEEFFSQLWLIPTPIPSARVPDPRER